MLFLIVQKQPPKHDGGKGEAAHQRVNVSVRSVRMRRLLSCRNAVSVDLL